MLWRRISAMDVILLQRTRDMEDHLSGIIRRQDQLDRELLEVSNMVAPVPGELEEMHNELIQKLEERNG